MSMNKPENNKTVKNIVTRRYANRVSVGNNRIVYKNVGLLRQFLTAQGKIISRSVSLLTTKQQRKITQHIKYARMTALLPFVSNDV